MDKYMTMNDVLKEYVEKVKCDKTFEMLTEEQKKLAINDFIKKIIQELYDTNESKISYLSERDTFIIRKLYGVLDNGKCSVGLQLQNELGVAVAVLKHKYFIRLNKQLEKYLDNINFEKKKKEFLNLVGGNLGLFRLNAYIFNQYKEREFWHVEEYFESTPLITIREDMKDFKFYIKSIDDLDKVGLSDVDKTIIIRFWGLIPEEERLTSKEIAKMYHIGRDLQLKLSRLYAKIRNYFAYEIKFERLEEERKDINSIINLGISARTYFCLKSAGINTKDDLLALTSEDLTRIRNLGRAGAAEVQMAIANLKNPRDIIIVEDDAAFEELSDLEQRKNELIIENAELDAKIAQAQSDIKSLEKEEKNGR